MIDHEASLRVRRGSRDEGKPSTGSIVLRRPKIRLATLMKTIALIGLALGGAAAIRSAWPEILWRRGAAADHEAQARFWRQVPAWIDDPCLSASRHPNKSSGVVGSGYDPHGPYFYNLNLYWFPQSDAYNESRRDHREEILGLCRERIAYHERMRYRWSRAAWTPWTEPEPDDPKPPIQANRVVDDSY